MAARMCFQKFVSGNGTESMSANFISRSQPGPAGALLFCYHNWRVSKQQEQSKDFPSDPSAVIAVFFEIVLCF